MIPRAAIKSTAASLGAATLAIAAGVAAQDRRSAREAREPAPAYRVVDGKVDAATYQGWRAFHSACHACHGVDATGTGVAPSLVERVRELSARDFSTKVLTSYRVVLQSGQLRGDDSTAARQAMVEQVLRRERGELIMPAWEGDVTVRPHVLDIYAYLRARADGALAAGRPERLAD